MRHAPRLALALAAAALLAACSPSDQGHLLDLVHDGEVVATIDSKASDGAAEIDAWLATAELTDGATVELESHENLKAQTFTYGYDITFDEGQWQLVFAGTDNTVGSSDSIEGLALVLRGELLFFVKHHREQNIDS